MTSKPFTDWSFDRQRIAEPRDMPSSPDPPRFKTAREKFLGLSLESTRKSYYPQLREQLDASRENEQRLQLLIDSLPAYISYIDNRRYFILVNRQCETMFGRNRSAIIGQPMESVFGTANFTELIPHVEQVLAGQTIRFETPMAFPDGSEKWLESSYIPVLDKDGVVAGFYTLALDLSEKKNAERERLQLEEKLRETGKFKAIGTLAGGIAHDFNNLLMGIQGRASLLNIGLEEDNPLREHAQAIEEYINSAANLTRQLLGLARGGKYEVKPTDLNRLLDDVARMFGRTHKEIIINQHVQKRPLIAEVDRNQIEQVLLNMFVNAWQAMPDGGTIYLETSVVEFDPTMQQAHDLTGSTFARISITDTGCGMNETIRQQVFDPFFTTKDKQRGTGLGLASAYGIVKNHAGTITVYSEVGHGATFNIYLPLSDGVEQHDPIGSQLIHHGSGTILLVDDEKMILTVGEALLTSLGYQPVLAESGQQAIDIISTPDRHIDLVIVDLIMPIMDGGMVFDRIRQLQPTLPVILSSGYSINGQAASIMARGCNGFIQKPFTINELSSIIRRILPED